MYTLHTRHQSTGYCIALRKPFLNLHTITRKRSRYSPHERGKYIKERWVLWHTIFDNLISLWQFFDPSVSLLSDSQLDRHRPPYKGGAGEREEGGEVNFPPTQNGCGNSGIKERERTCYCINQRRGRGNVHTNTDWGEGGKNIVFECISKHLSCRGREKRRWKIDLKMEEWMSEIELGWGGEYIFTFFKIL